MSKDWFEKSLRENYPSEVHDFDADAAWAALEARRRNKRRRPFVFWWTAVLGMLLLGAAGLALWQPGKDERPAPIPGLKPPAAQLTQKPPVADLKKVSNHSVVAEPIVRQVGQESSRATPDPNPLPRAGLLSSEARLTNYSSDEYVAKQDIAYHTRPRIHPTINSSQEPPSDELNSPSPRGEVLGEGPTHSGSQHPIPILSFLEPQIPILGHATQDLPEPPGFLLGELKKRPKFKMPRWWIGASVHYGLSNVSRSGMSDYLKKRDSEETALDMFQAGFDIRRRLGSRFFLQTGVYFTQWTDARERVFKETFTVADSNYLIARLIKADGSVEDIYGAAELVHTRTVTEETYNRYSHLELPLLAGVSLPVGGRWRLDGSVGPVFGLLAFRSGTISGNLNGAQIPLEDAPYRNSLTFSGMLRLEWTYATQDWAAGVGLMGRMALNDWAETNPLFSEKRHAIGAGLVFRKALR